MQEIIDIEKLEHVMITNWLQFLDVRKLMTFAKNVIIEHHHIEEHYTVQQLAVSRFEFQSRGFIVWLEVNIQKVDKKVNATIEILLSGSELFYITSTLG